MSRYLTISSAALRQSVARKELVWQEDIRDLDISNKKYDMVLCVEVAEHIPKDYANTLVQYITSAGDLVIFSASPKGLGGTNHVNEQPMEYWYKKFSDCGFDYCEEETIKLSAKVKEKNMPHWLWEDIMVFRRTNNLN